MISQTQTASNQYGFYAVPKKLQPKKKYRQSEYQDFYDNGEDNQNEFEDIDRQKVPENTVQKDFYVDEAPYPEFKPKQRGLDYGVQIQKGDLFDYDLEVLPLLQILVGRSVVSAINQLQEEKQKVEKRQKLQTYQKKRNAQLMVTQRLEAKSKRKKQQSERRVLQKQTYVKNQQQVGKKIIARKTAKKNLLGLKNQVLNQLEEAGYLRSQVYTDLRINYEGWLYEQITSLIKQDRKIATQVQKIVNQIQNENEKQHKGKIEKQKRRRQQILDDRERIKKLNQEKKEKKRIKKQRIELNSQRESNAITFDELLEKYQEFQNILKFQNRSNGFSTSNSTVSTAYVAGGLMNFVIAILNSTQKQYSAEQVEEILAKLINESNSPLQLEFGQDHLNLVQEEVQKVQQNPNQFMKNKAARVTSLKQKISLNLKLLEMGKVNIKQSLHENLLQALLNIVLNSVSISKPQGQSEEQFYQPNQKDKQREQLKKKIQLNCFKGSLLSELKMILRVRFERKYKEEDEQKKSQTPAASQDQWVDIYDGQGWNHHTKQYPEQCNRQTQKPAALNLSSFDRSFIVDQRTLHYLKKQIQRLLQIQAGNSVDKYIEELANLNGQLMKEIPVYDGELRMQ